MREIRNIILSLLLFVGLFSGLFFGALHITSQFNIKEDSLAFGSNNNLNDSSNDIFPHSTTNAIPNNESHQEDETETFSVDFWHTFCKYYDESDGFQTDDNNFKICEEERSQDEADSLELNDKSDMKASEFVTPCQKADQDDFSGLGINFEDAYIIYNDKYLLMIASPKNMISNDASFCEALYPEINQFIELINRESRKFDDIYEESRMISIFKKVIDTMNNSIHFNTNYTDNYVAKTEKLIEEDGSAKMFLHFKRDDTKKIDQDDPDIYIEIIIDFF